MRRLVFALLFAAAAFAQPRQLAPVPEDPHELVKGPVQVLTGVEERAAMTSLLNRAAVSFAFHARGAAPYDAKIAFTSAGPWSEQGQGQIKEIWANGQQWRWSASVGGYSQLRIFSKGIAYDDHPVGMPMPVHILRSAIFNPVHNIGTNMNVRSITTSLNGHEVTCGLYTGGSVEPANTPGRRWSENEYCVDANSGLLEMYSDAPGIYVVYDYTGAAQFHGRTIPLKVAIYEAGAKVIDATLSVSDSSAGQEVFRPTAQMTAGGPGAIMGGISHLTHVLTAPAGDALVQPTIVHALIDSSGSVTEAVALQSSGMSAQALEAVKRFKFGHRPPGSIEYQWMAFINVQFAPAGAEQQ